jgi:hypothetical protein
MIVAIVAFNTSSTDAFDESVALATASTSSALFMVVVYSFKIVVTKRKFSRCPAHKRERYLNFFSTKALGDSHPRGRTIAKKIIQWTHPHPVIFEVL